MEPSPEDVKLIEYLSKVPEDQRETIIGIHKNQLRSNYARKKELELELQALERAILLRETVLLNLQD